MKVELWPIGRIKPYENNPRLNDDAIDAVVASLREFGFRQPIVVDAEGVIVCGHTRYKAALNLGLGRSRRLHLICAVDEELSVLLIPFTHSAVASSRS